MTSPSETELVAALREIYLTSCDESPLVVADLCGQAATQIETLLSEREALREAAQALRDKTQLVDPWMKKHWQAEAAALDALLTPSGK